jgi:hypothetical protein
MALTVAFYFSKIDILGLTIKIVFNEKVLPHFIYMFAVLAIGLSLLVKHAHRFHKCTLRKLFHILALVMFTPTLL